ncbi:hypothetical protein TrRE_jg7876, partial [Triparma retinervis]
MSAKMSVKHDIFSPWHESQLDHAVSVMYTPHLNDSKRDYVEYTSSGFLSHPHTMVTYTAASDSCLCAPLMIDAAVWCDYFARRDWDVARTSRALAYLFKVPDGAAKGVDPGFFKQMETLKEEAYRAGGIQGTPGKVPPVDSAVGKVSGGKGHNNPRLVRRVRIKETIRARGSPRPKWSVPHSRAGVICAGLACIDLQVTGCSSSVNAEDIGTFKSVVTDAGGSVPNALGALARMTYGRDKVGMFVPPPVFGTVAAVCAVGGDEEGGTLRDIIKDKGKGSGNVETRTVKIVEGGTTGKAVLPIYQDGRRGCWYNAGVNERVTGEFMGEIVKGCGGVRAGGTIFGYPNLLPGIRGEGGGV